MRTGRAVVVWAVVAGAVATTPLAAAAQTTTSTTQAICAHPDHLRATGRLADARTEYLAILKAHPGAAACALAGLGALDAGLCATADALRNAGRRDEAAKAYTAALEQQPSSGCAGAGLAELRGSACAGADALQARGNRDKAAEAYTKVLEQDPGSRCAREGLAGGWRERAATWRADALAALTALATALAAVLVALWLLLHTARIPGMRRQLRRVPALRRMLRHRFTFDRFDESAAPDGAKCSAPLSMQVQAEVLRASGSTMEAPGGESALATTLEGLKELGDQFKLATALAHLVEKTLPIQRFKVSGSMAWSRRGAGMALSVERAQEPPSGGEVWQRLASEAPATGDPAPDDFYELVPQAAGWVTFELGRRLAPRQWVVASNAESYALARAGIVLKDRADLPRARAFLVRALELDHENVTALSNLALVEAAENHPDDAVRYLERARAILERKLA